MPITLLDVILLVVMLISGLLAMIRGFMREILSIAAWIIAAIVTLYAYPRVLPLAEGYVSSKMVATGIAVGGVFLITLLLVSIITVRRERLTRCRSRSSTSFCWWSCSSQGCSP